MWSESTGKDLVILGPASQELVELQLPWAIRFDFGFMAARELEETTGLATSTNIYIYLIHPDSGQSGTGLEQAVLFTRQAPASLWTQRYGHQEPKKARL